jgi:hypothetical protein
MVPKLDLYAKHKADYAAPRKPILLTIPSARYLAISGKGRPPHPEFDAAIGALYNVAFTVKMARKFAGRDYTVSKLEGLWPGLPPKPWRWQLLIRVPSFITAAEVKGGITGLIAKGKPRTVAKVTLITLVEGRCVQMLHVGPYDQEEPTLALMRDHAIAQGTRTRGVHHEIYLSDPRRVPPERLKTILRVPVR